MYRANVLFILVCLLPLSAQGGMNNCDGDIINCTIVDNNAGQGGGLRRCDGKTINCVLWSNTPDQIFEGTPPVYSCIQDWALGGMGNISTDPLFANAGADDYHLQSAAGRWDPIGGQWLLDGVTSRCIDAGNPGEEMGQEPVSVSNLRINLGAYGKTSQASKTPAGWSLLGDLTNDGTVNFLDASGQDNDWMISGPELYGDLNRDGTINVFDLSLLITDWLESTLWH